MYTRLRAIILAFTLLILASPNYAGALSCIARTNEQQLEGANTIFIGKVTSVNISVDTSQSTATFDVLEYWKGPVGKKVTLTGIYAWTGRENPPPYFKVNNEYLVFANANPKTNSMNAIVDCSWTRLAAEAEVIKEIMRPILGAGKVPTTIVDTPPTAPAPAPPQTPPKLPVQPSLPGEAIV